MNDSTNRIGIASVPETPEQPEAQRDCMVLIVDNDSARARKMRTDLEEQGIEAGEAHSLEKMRMRLKMLDFDAVLIDGDDFESSLADLVRTIRDINVVLPIFLLASHVEDEKQICAYRMGVSDILPKPLNPRLFAAKALSLMQVHRGAPPPANQLITAGDIVVDPIRHTVTRSGIPVHLSIMEFKALRFMMNHPGNLLTHGMVSEYLWGQSSEDLRTRIRVLINNLRRKIEPDPGHPKYIVTEMHLGYRLNPR